MAAERGLQPRVAGQLLGLAARGVEPDHVARERTAERRLEPTVGPACLAALREGVIPVERNSERDERKQREPEDELQLEASDHGLKPQARAADSSSQQ